MFLHCTRDARVVFLVRKKERKVLRLIDFDLNHDGILDAIERATAETYCRSLFGGEDYDDAFLDDGIDISFEDGEDDYFFGADDEW